MQPKAQNRIKHIIELLSLEVIAISTVFLAALYVFGTIIDDVIYKKQILFDNEVFAYFSGHSTPAFIETMKVFTFFGSQMFLLPAYIFLISYFMLTGKLRNGIDIAVIALSSSAIIFILKNFTHRKRPDLPVIKGITNFSFPSGHALSIFIFSSVLLNMIWRASISSPMKWLWSVVLFVFTMTVGVSRIVLRVHYPTDVVASFCLGTMWVIISFWLLREISKKKAIILENGKDDIPEL